MSWTLLLFLLSISYGVSKLVRGLHKARHQARFAEDHNCASPAKLQPGQIIGLSTTLDYYRSVKDGTAFEKTLQRFITIGTTFEGKRFGTTTIQTIDPVNLECVLKTNANDYLVGPSKAALFEGFIGKSAFSVDGEEWKHHRSILRPAFSKKNLSSFTAYEPHVQRLLGLLPSDGKPVDLQALFSKLTFDVSNTYLFGGCGPLLLEEDQDDSKAEFAKAVDRCNSAGLTKYMLGWVDRFRPQRSYWRDTELVHRFADRYIDLALAEQTSKPGLNDGGVAEKGERTSSFLQSLAQTTNSRQELRDAAMTLLVGGRDTTASFLSHLFLCLSRHPRVWKKLRDEVKVLDGAEPDPQNVRQLTYLRQCMDEALRWAPPAPYTARTAARDTIIPRGGGSDQTSPVLIREGTSVVINLWALQHMPSIWGEDAAEYRPERWDSPPPAWAYLPFSGGPRKCIGYEFAQNTAMYVTARLVQEFEELGSADDRPWVPNLGMTMDSRHGVWVKLRA